MPYCPRCGAAVSADDRFCPECGAGLDDEVGGDDVTEAVVEGTSQPTPEQSAEADYDPTSSGILGFSIEFPGRAGLGTVVIGGVLALLSILILPLFILTGYFIRTTDAAAHGEPTPPSFDDIGGMFVDGIVFTLAILPWIIALFILFALGAAIDSALYFIGLVLVSVLVWYIAPAIFVNFAVTREWSAVYDLSAIADLAFTGTYLWGFFLFVVVINWIGAIVFLIVAMLSFLTIIGWIIIIPMLYFYWYAIDASLWGRVYYKLHH